MAIFPSAGHAKMYHHIMRCPTGVGPYAELAVDGPAHQPPVHLQEACARQSVFLQSIRRCSVTPYAPPLALLLPLSSLSAESGQAWCAL